MEEGSSEGRKHETTVRGTNIALRICALCLLWGFLHCLQAVEGCAREIRRSEVVG